MINKNKIIALRMSRQHLTRKATETEYIELYRDTQPGQNVYWNGFGDPPSLTYRADFNDTEYNRERQRTRALIKGRFCGGNLGWIMPEDLELFACAFRKPLDKPTERQLVLLDLIEREGPMNIQLMKELTGLLVKEITPALHRLQEAFLIYEDQNDGDWDRGWFKFAEMFPSVDLTKYSRVEALKILIKRFAYRHVLFDTNMVRSFYKLPAKEIKVAIEALAAEGVLIESDGGYILKSDEEALQSECFREAETSREYEVFAMHRNDFLVKSNEYWLKEKYTHPHPDTLYYIMINGEFCGAAAGKFRYTPEVEDIILNLPPEEATARKEKILQAVHVLCGADNPIKRYQGMEV